MINLMSNNTIKTISTFHNVYGGKSYLKKMYNKGLSKTDHIVAISEYVKETDNSKPINPYADKENILGEKVYKNLSEIDIGIDILNILVLYSISYWNPLNIFQLFYNSSSVGLYFGT